MRAARGRIAASPAVAVVNGLGARLAAVVREEEEVSRDQPRSAEAAVGDEKAPRSGLRDDGGNLVAPPASDGKVARRATLGPRRQEGGGDGGGRHAAPRS